VTPDLAPTQKGDTTPLTVVSLVNDHLEQI